MTETIKMLVEIYRRMIRDREKDSAPEIADNFGGLAAMMDRYEERIKNVK